jgi:hypothetical protein
MSDKVPFGRIHFGCCFLSAARICRSSCANAGTSAKSSVHSVLMTASALHVFVASRRIEDPIPPGFPSFLRIEHRHVQHKHWVVIATARLQPGAPTAILIALDLFGSCTVHRCISFQRIKLPAVTWEVVLVGFDVSSRREFRIPEARTCPH